ncbi:hypothetical protein N7453_006218 [Penicillium expansum]|nr:hypothetical protein N7453_006218 [Penicillium expansum]
MTCRKSNGIHSEFYQGTHLLLSGDYEFFCRKLSSAGATKGKYHAEDEVGHYNHASRATIGARPMGGEVPGGTGGYLSTDDCSHAR